MSNIYFFFFFQAEDGIRDSSVTGVQTCALPISWEGEWGLTPSRRSCAISQSPGWAVPTRSPRRFSGSAVLAPASCLAWPCRLTAALQPTEVRRAPIPAIFRFAFKRARYGKALIVKLQIAQQPLVRKPHWFLIAP